VEQLLRFQARREVLHQLAPKYRQSTPVQKRTLLEAFVATTGYVRTYARWLLNHAEEVQQMHGRSHLRKYGPEVQHTLFLVWNAANRICAKRLIPFLPTLVEALERHEHLHLSEECAIPTAFHECCDGGSSPTIHAQTRPRRSLHDASRNPAEAADSDPYLRGVEGDQTRFDFQRTW